MAHKIEGQVQGVATKSTSEAHAGVKAATHHWIHHVVHYIHRKLYQQLVMHTPHQHLAMHTPHQQQAMHSPHQQPYHGKSGLHLPHPSQAQGRELLGVQRLMPTEGHSIPETTSRCK